MKIARFTDVVKSCGRPRIHLAWVAPPSDPELQRAAKKHRVLTVHQRSRGAKKDFAVVGFEEGKDAQYLLFDRSLARFEGKQVVGIRYELLEDSLSVGPTPKGRSPERPNLRSGKKAGGSGGKVLPFVMPENGHSGGVKPPAVPKAARHPKVAPAASKAAKLSLKPKMDRPPLELMKDEVRWAVEELVVGENGNALRRLRALLKL